MIDTLAMCGLLYALVVTDTDVPINIRREADTRMLRIVEIVNAKGLTDQVAEEMDRVVLAAKANPAEVLRRIYEISETCRVLATPEE